jgi:hypothetical protein
MEGQKVSITKAEVSNSRAPSSRQGRDCSAWDSREVGWVASDCFSRLCRAYSDPTPVTILPKHDAQLITETKTAGVAAPSSAAGQDA